VNVADASVSIDDAIERHAPEFEDVDFLTIQSRHFMVGVCQPNEGDIFLVPVFFEGLKIIGTYSDDLRTACLKLGIMIAHTRQLRATVRSHEAA